MQDSDYQTLEHLMDYARDKPYVQAACVGRQRPDKAVIEYRASGLPPRVMRALTSLDTQPVEVDGSVKWAVFL